jgi:acyl-CoA thioesterase I
MSRSQRRCRLPVALPAALPAALAAAAALFLLAVPPGRAETDECAAPAEMTEVSVKLPHLAQRLRARERVNIVAVGGASTSGKAAGSPDLAYPHRLQLALADFFPEVPITVVNKGVPRQSTRQMLERFATDVIPEDPILVVWETGISDAVRGIEVDDFAAALQIGIEDIKNRAIDILLVDMQFSRSTATVIDFERYLNTLHRVGDLNGIYVFPRFEMMRYWSEQNMFNFDEIAADERARLAARAYDCIGRKLAQAIRLAVQ